MFLLVSSNLLIEKKVNLTLKKKQHYEKLLACLLLVIMNLKRYLCK